MKDLEMNEFKKLILNDCITLGKLYRENQWMLPATLVGMAVGGFFGVMGFYGGWLG